MPGKNSAKRWVIAPMTLLCGAYFVLNSFSWHVRWGDREIQCVSKWRNIKEQVGDWLHEAGNHRLNWPAAGGTGAFKLDLGRFQEQPPDDEGDRVFYVVMPDPVFRRLSASGLEQAHLDGEPAVLARRTTQYAYLFFPNCKVLLLGAGGDEGLVAFATEFYNFSQHGVLRYQEETLTAVEDEMGLGGVEGPYPGQPVVQWGLGPETRLRTTAIKSGSYHVTLKFRNFWHDQRLTVNVNGIRTGDFIVPVSEPSSQGPFHKLAFNAKLQKGSNRIKIMYSRWNDSLTGDTRPMAVLFSNITLAQER